MGIYISGSANSFMSCGRTVSRAADSIGNRFVLTSMPPVCLAWRDANGVLQLSRDVTAEAEVANDVVTKVLVCMSKPYLAIATKRRPTIAGVALEAATELGGFTKIQGGADNCAALPRAT